MAAVREAERRLLETEATKSYLDLAGHDRFNAGMTALVFGDADARAHPGGADAWRHRCGAACWPS